MRVDIIPPEDTSLIRIMRKIFQSKDESDELPGVDMTLDEALENLKLERKKRKIKIKRLESQLEKNSLSEEQKNKLLKLKNRHDEWKYFIDDTLEEYE